MAGRGVLWLLGGMTVLLFVLSLGVGHESINIADTMAELLAGEQTVHTAILLDLRLPRALIAVLAGATLGLAGAAMQGLLRNPLASPGLTGSASGAALLAVATLYYGLTAVGSWLLPIAGMCGSLLATWLVYQLSGRGSSISTLILAGIAVNALATALISLLLNLAPSPYAVQELVMWTLGDLTDRSLDDLWLMLPTTLLGWALLAGCGHDLDTLTLGERTAVSMGIDIHRLRWRVFVGVSLCVGAAVATTGMIGFIGLVVPHLIRPFVGYLPGKLLPASMLGGAALLLAADIGVKLIPSEMPLRVGVLTSLVGAPFFLHLILRNRRDYLS